QDKRTGNELREATARTTKQSELVSNVFFWLNRPSAPLRGSIASQKKMRSVQRSIEKTGEFPNLFIDRGSRTKRPFPNEKASSS
ncbi:hypothetical protein P3682_27455, partial [Vibrio parahaemolyticus]|nr:hypothetical protein [Vibrio parahaemolyticus]